MVYFLREILLIGFLAAISRSVNTCFVSKAETPTTDSIILTTMSTNKVTTSRLNVELLENNMRIWNGARFPTNETVFKKEFIILNTTIVEDKYKCYDDCVSRDFGICYMFQYELPTKSCELYSIRNDSFGYYMNLPASILIDDSFYASGFIFID